MEPSDTRFSPDTSADARLREMARRVTEHVPSANPPGDTARAAVALIVRPGPRDIELLLIKRTVFPGDPWSGHMALPGGRQEPHDTDALATAVRETEEEVSIDLRTDGTLLGALDPTLPMSGAFRLVVSPFAFSVPPSTTAIPNHEAELALWVPINKLHHPAATVEHIHRLPDGSTRRFPAFGYGDYTIWGLTHRILSHFFEVAFAPGPNAR